MAGETMKTISRTDLARHTREVVNAVRQGRPALVESYGEEQVVLLDALDFRLLTGVVAWATSRLGHTPRTEATTGRVLEEYLDENISLGKAAERLGISRFELMERLERLGVPLRLGPASLAEAEAEVEAARRAGPSI